MNLVFAHFNAPIPKFLVNNIDRTIALFPKKSVYLLTNLQKSLPKNTELEIFSIYPNHEWTLLENSITHPKFRSNFPFTSMFRFLALSKFMSEINGEVLHIESDVIISESFPFKKLSENGALLAFPIVNDHLGIASTLYLKNKKAARLLALETITSASKNPKTTDMHVLSEIRYRYPLLFQLLPTTPSKGLENTKLDFIQMNNDAISFFDGLFDAADLGRYLFGDDPRNMSGISRLRTNFPTTYHNIRNLKLGKSKSSDFPYSTRDGSGVLPIYSLHLHSKKAKLFKQKQFKKAMTRALLNYQKKPSQKIVLHIWIRSLPRRLVRKLYYRQVYSM